jgi:hypothetical protein
MNESRIGASTPRLMKTPHECGNESKKKKQNPSSHHEKDYHSPRGKRQPCCFRSCQFAGV